ncbi:MAG TPA: calcium-binding protein, partial [Acidimicrobiales bacterium]|nr:calcium-binding protein [Acidimicrobiales bacterium]
MRRTRLTRSPARKVIVVALAVGLAVLWWGWSLPANADGSDVAQHLGEASTALGRLTGSVGPEGGYGGEPNAGAVPFLGADPTHGIPGVFEQLSGLSQFAGFNADDDQTAQVITDKINAVDGALDHVDLSDPVYCGGTCNKDTKVADVTSIQFRVSATDDRPPGEVSFTSLGLPSMSFLPKGGKLTVDLNWSVNVDVIADANGLRMVPIAGQHALVLDAHITLPTDPFTVNLGALKVEATSTTQPGFHGKLTVDVDNAGAFSYGFDDAGFKADWHLKTKDDSPLTGIETDLDINWLLSGPHVNTSGLNIKLDHIKVDARKLVGEDLADAAGDLRDVIHPIRTATSPLLEPIPGLSDLSNVIQQGDVSMARLAQYAGGEDGTNLRKTLERIVLVDDVLGSLSGGDDTPDLGSITLTGETAVQPAGAINVEGLKSIAEKCEQCKQAMDAILKAANGTELSFDQGFKFDFPVMRNPATLAGLLFGRDVDLVTFDTGKIGLDTHVHIPIASIIIFDIEVDGDIKALVHLKGGLDTRGIKDALSAGGGFADVLNGIYLQHPDSGAVARLESDVGLKAAVGFGLAKIGGGPSLHVVLDVPPSLPDGKLRPALVDDLGCTLLSGPNARADFGVFISAEYDLIFDSHTDILASHTFLTREDLCQPEAKADEVAELVNGRLQIKTGSQRDVPGGQPDMVKVYARHDNQGVPTSIVVSVNNNKHVEKPAKDVTTVAYDSAGDNRPVNFRAVASDGKAFEKSVDIATGDGIDDVMLDTESFARVVVNGGDDKVIATAGGGLIGGGAGNDYLSGGPHVDFLGGGPGNDTLDGLGGSDSLFGGPGDDALLDSSPDHNCLAGEAGSDRLLSGFGGDDLSGDEGSLFSACAASNPNPEEAGDPAGGADRIVTGGGHDRVFGGNGDDDVRLNGGEVPGKPDNPAYAANVIVHGNGGKDRITTGDGGDYIHGGPDDDVIHAGQG